MQMKKDFFENSLGNETIEVLGFKTIEALEKELELLTEELKDEQARFTYKGQFVYTASDSLE